MCKVGVNSRSSHPFLVGTAKIIFNSFNGLNFSGARREASGLVV